MQVVEGKVAVVTGAASGIGRAMARVFGAAGMKVALADVEAGALRESRNALAADGVEAVAFVCDVSQADAVYKLAEDTRAAFGSVHVVCNNAGVFCGGTSWGTSLNDYEWILKVNVWGVIHGIRTFVPILLQQDEGHVVNTASMAALTAMPFAAAYHMSKHAVLALSEVLYHELRSQGAKVGVSAVCPEAVATHIDHAERNRPAELRRPAGSGTSPDVELVDGAIRAAVAGGISPDVIAARALRAIREDRFYVLSDDDAWRRSASSRLEDVRLVRNPVLVPPV